MDINKCLIITQFEEFYNELDDLLRQLPFLSLTKHASSIDNAIGNIKEFQPQMAFIDVDTIPQQEVFQLSEIICDNLPIIIISKDANEAVESYTNSIAVDFVLKPLRLERLMKAINKAFRQHISYSGMRGFDFVFLKTGRIYKKFFLNDIIYVEAYGIYVKIYSESGKFIINDSISKIEEKLPNNSFLRIHKSFIINTNKILSFGTSHFEFTLGNVPIGTSYKHRIEGLLKMLSKAHLN